jgi:hypothetical protein
LCPPPCGPPDTGGFGGDGGLDTITIEIKINYE